MNNKSTGTPGRGFSRGRRRLLEALPLLALPTSLVAQEAMPVAVRKLHAFDIRVRDVNRSLSFYQDLFAAPIQVRQGESVCLRIGNGPHFFSLSPAGAAQPGFSHSGLSVADYGLWARPDGGDTEALMHWISMRMPNRGGAEGGTPELYFTDPDGIRIQLQDPGYCGGGGYLGDDCPSRA